MNRVKVNSDVELKDRLVAINRVTKVTKGGRTFTFAAIVVVGDGNGVIGWGLGKAGEVTAAIQKGTDSAKKNLVKIRYWSEGRWCHACRSRECRYSRFDSKVERLFKPT